jgi:hypothetical protein
MYIILIKLMFSSRGIGDHNRFWLSCFMPFHYIAPNIFKLFGFPIFRFWGYVMKVILRVRDEGYFEGTWWRLFWGYLMKVILRVPDECYFEGTWWRLFWGYLMKVILRVRDEDYSRNASFALNLISTFLLQ